MAFALRPWTSSETNHCIEWKCQGQHNANFQIVLSWLPDMSFLVDTERAFLTRQRWDLWIPVSLCSAGVLAPWDSLFITQAALEPCLLPRPHLPFLKMLPFVGSLSQSGTQVSFRIFYSSYFTGMTQCLGWACTHFENLHVSPLLFGPLFSSNS